MIDANVPIWVCATPVDMRKGFDSLAEHVRAFLGRDPERTPMPWDGSGSAGFTTGRPWLPLGADHEEVNVAALELDGASILHLYRKLIDLRRSRPTLVSGRMQFVSADRGVLRYERRGGRWQ